jgi:hypothetical protein
MEHPRSSRRHRPRKPDPDDPSATTTQKKRVVRRPETQFHTGSGFPLQGVDHSTYVSSVKSDIFQVQMRLER